MKGSDKAGIALAAIVLSVAAFLFFQNLSSPAIRIWDEAIYADNALDMYSYGNPLVMYRNGEPTLYNTKPPFVIWMQTLSMHVFGVSEFAVRFPSALAGVLICVMLLVFAHFTLKDLRVGILGVLFLCTAGGFNHQHVTRTGDLDAVLTFWTTWYALLFLHLLIRKPERDRLLFGLVGVGILGAFLSKSVAGLMPVAGLFLVMCVAKRAGYFLRKWWTWFVTGCVLVLCMGFYALREVYAPGYLYVAWYSDYTRFYSNILTWHNHPWYYYFWNWQRLDFFTPYVYWLPLAALIGLLHKETRRPTGYMLLHTLTFIAIISYPIVKLMWYDAPAYPFMALLCSMGVVAVFDRCMRKITDQAQWKDLIFACLIIGVFAYPVMHLGRIHADEYLPVDILEREGFSVRDLHRTQASLRKYNVLMMAGQNAHFTQLDFYLNTANRYWDKDITLLKDTSTVRVGDTILCCQENQVQWLRDNFALQELTSTEIGCPLVVVGDRVRRE